ncbi:FecR family protein [Erythrobacter sp. NE805]|uniref:FecR family protein n=1 Tax=Erythrobacter sp. NE805 TaxID=3389875 RepID=UPI00396B0710
MKGMMKQSAKTNAIDDAAAGWLARVDRGALADHEQAAFDAWLAEDVRHRGAYIRMQAIFAASERVSALGKGFAEPSGGPQRWWWTGGIAASLALALAALSTSPFGGTGAEAPRVAAVNGTISSPSAKSTSNIDLPDGSRVELAAQARASTSFRPDARIVTLLGGEALFSVAKDPTRPFTVVAGNVRVTAIGTSFTVSRDKGRVSVKVLEGVVAIERDGEEGATRLSANEMASFTARPIATPPSAKSVAAERPKPAPGKPQMLAFEARPLSEAVLAFNAASVGTRIRIDPALRARPITGLFSLSDPEGFAEAVAISLDAQIAREGGTIVIVP